jgi:hypothetical protein
MDEDITQKKAYSEQLVNLLIATSEVSQAWIKFLITIQGALAAGFGYLLLLNDVQFTRMHGFLAGTLCVFGASLAVAITAASVRHAKWQAFYVRKHVALNSTAVFPAHNGDETAPKTVSEIEFGPVAKIIIGMGSLLTGAWTVAIGVVICRLLA